MGIIDFLSKKKNEGSWVIAESKEDGFPIMYRLRTNVPDNIKIDDYPILISILWEYESDNTSGMPSDDLHEQQLKLGDALEKMDNTGIGTMMVAITGNGRKEWVWYVNNMQDWLKQLIECLKGHPAYPLDIGESQDYGWQTWSSIKNGMK